VASLDEYRRQADECLRLAQNTPNPQDKALLLTMAEAWTRFAEQAAKIQNLAEKTEGLDGPD